jgi:acyl-coenzyme A thioesterase PaaI-like protein
VSTRDSRPATPEDTGDERRHILQELGFSVRRAGEELHGSASLVPEMSVPGTTQLRASILASWADVLTGMLAVDVMTPRVPVTLELDVQLFRPPPGAGTVVGIGRVVKTGRTVFVGTADFATADGEPIGFGAASFVAVPDERVVMTMPTSVDRIVPPGRRLEVPFAERAGCERREPGVAVLPHSDESRNASNTLNGGLIALAVEEAALSLTPGATLASLALRYLQPARVGPVVAQAEVRDGVGRIEVRDLGNDDRLCVLASSRVFPT